jgi:hypothetical protein
MNLLTKDWKPTHEEQAQIKKEKRNGDFIALMVIMLLFGAVMKIGWVVFQVLSVRF